VRPIDRVAAVQCAQYASLYFQLSSQDFFLWSPIKKVTRFQISRNWLEPALCPVRRAHELFASHLWYKDLSRSTYLGMFDYLFENSSVRGSN
jgi:hypothetical protein